MSPAVPLSAFLASGIGWTANCCCRLQASATALLRASASLPSFKNCNNECSYIHDASMVGTVFCHAVSNALASSIFNCNLLLSVRGVTDVALLQCSPQPDILVTENGFLVRVHLGHLQAGQKRAVVMRSRLPSDFDSTGFSIQVVRTLSQICPWKLDALLTRTVRPNRLSSLMASPPARSRQKLTS